MTDSDQNTDQPEAGAAPQPAQFRVLTQYIKDLSFENPLAPNSMAQTDGKPNIGVNVDINAQRIAPTQFETAICLNVESQLNGQVQFIVELEYAGLFHIENVPQENLEPLLLIESPRMLFPFARRIISDVSRDGGFPPLLVDPIDFTNVYRRQLQRRAEAENGSGAISPATPSFTTA